MTLTAHPPARAQAPGPRGFPVVGVIPFLIRDNLGFTLRMARDYGDVVHYRVGQNPVYLVNHPDAIKRVLVDNNHNYGKGSFQVGTLKTVVGNGLLMSEGEFWLRQRRLMQPVFHRKHLATFAEAMITITRETMDRWEARPDPTAPLDMAFEMMQLTLNVATQTLFSTRVTSDMQELSQLIKFLAEDVEFRFEVPLYPSIGVPTPRNRRFNRALARLDQLIYSIIEQRRRELDAGHRPDDLLTMLLEARDPETGAGMTDLQLRDEAMTLFSAGHETTAKALSWLWMLLSTHPHVERTLHAEVTTVLEERDPTVADLRSLSYTRQVIEETMRLYPPAWITSRQAVEEDELCGYTIPAGALVWMSPYVMHRHPAYWDNPEGFDPERFAPAMADTRPKFSYFPFGGGPHLCIGRDFAMMELQLVVAEIVRRYRLALLPGSHVLPVGHITLAPKTQLWMMPRRR